jgi:hypothetical protein
MKTGFLFCFISATVPRYGTEAFCRVRFLLIRRSLYYSVVLSNERADQRETGFAIARQWDGVEWQLSGCEKGL